MGESLRIDSLRSLGKYALIQKISDGYLGPVYRSFDPDLDRAVEIRVLCDGIKWDADVVDLFRKECASVACLQHPNIAAIVEAGTEGGYPYIVMEPLGDRNLKKLVAQMPAMSFETKISIMIQVAEGMDYAHKGGILHRNLSPENIFLAADGCIKIRDFSIAYALMKYLPRPGVRWGAPIYLSPEQIKHKQSSVQSDIFASGMVFYELLTGVHPFYDPDSNKALDNILQDMPIPTFERYPDFHPRIWRILKTCLAKNPEDRYRDVNEMLDAYRRLLEDMAEDVQLMLSEMQASFMSLKIAAERPNATESAVRLYHNVQNLLHGVENADYMRLDQLIANLIEVYPEIREAAGEQKKLDSILLPRIRLEELNSAQKDEALSGEESLLFPKQAASLPSQQEWEAYGVSLFEDPFVSASMEAEVAQEVAQEVPQPEAPVVEAPAVREENGSSDAGNEVEVPYRPDRITVTQSEDSPVDLHDSKKIIETVPEQSEKQPAQESGTIRQEAAETGGKPPRRRRLFQRKHYRIPKPTYRTAVALLSILLITVAVHVVRRPGAAGALRSAWKNYVLDPLTVKAATLKQFSSENDENASAGNVDILDRHASPEFESALVNELEETFPGDGLTIPSQERLEGIAALILRGKLEPAEAELVKLRQLYPKSSEVEELYRQLQERASGSDSNWKQMEQERLNAVRNKEDSWNRQFLNYFSRGMYKEAENVAGVWLGDLPESAMARESGEKIKEVQTRIAACKAAMGDGRYAEALGDLNIVEIINPADPDIAVLRAEIESRKTSARGTLTVYRLGAGAALLLDGNRIGKDSEIQDISIPIGSHTIAVEKDGYLVASRSQELLEGQALTLVYDLDQRNIRPMIESDRDLLAQRNSMEEVHRFTSVHNHGIFRGTCSGELSIGYSEVEYRPSSGDHGFRIPFKLLKLKFNGRTVDLYFISDNEHLHEFKFEDEQTALRFNQTWKDLKSLP